MINLEEVYIVDFLRSPFSRSRPQKPETDVFNKIDMPTVAAMLVKEIVNRTNVDPREIGDIVTGCTMQMKENWLFGGRIIPILAELPVEVPAQGTERVCISGMSAMHQCAMEIMLGYSEITIACGIEHMTHLPMQLEFNPCMAVSPTIMQRFDLIQKYDLMTAIVMGLTAEKLFEKYKDEIGWIKRDLDEWGVRSHMKATKALKDGYFHNGAGYNIKFKGSVKGEILPIEVELADGTRRVIDSDQSIRPDTSLEAVEKLPPAFKPGGVITAGNSSPLNAGAAAIMLMSKKKMREYDLEPMAKILSLGWAGVDPSVMGEGPVPASRKALKHAGLEVKDIDYWEINEAFAVVTLFAIKKLGIEPEKVNVKGGAIAIGHPLAVSGIRITGTLARILNIENAKYGLATLCGGGGQGGAVVIENPNV
ncbi:MAG: acetyl-CoA C-acetyltransferase [Archaeoglobaceae archaeon]|nr:acetyl-CoA C-acetyltransferase [Archaeoglobaceae archaeon]MCX8152375.1 acetyl-CoA C-acetyltransferase [Archaeoglobaceae archaeon]MDW8013715.1 acetyl-CoA C-acetyltransferase [Archaeoglobaceae archaeon]